MAFDSSMRRACLALPALFVVALSGCGGPGGAGEEIPGVPEFDVIADAYLFDARVIRDGKPTSVRLEIYYTDTLIGIGGRGYLGKGALKGTLDQDSILVYFPSSNEYVDEPVAELLQSDQCPDARVRLPLSGLFSTTPDSLTLEGDLAVAANYLDPKHPRFLISASDCPWRFEIAYDRRDDRWEIDRFEFDNGGNLSLTGNLRTVKFQARVSSRRFAVAIPPGARRLEP